ncbi:homeobox protein OTX1 A-like [Mastomys coucha]|uniref:homeobox protein OTX1 A-like n=1 Tax=Mastomys coucha TaxID=35658 RepID=UPI00126217EE|nr:homeobox protein OTX1 A-like [Mastomys coucha]
METMFQETQCLDVLTRGVLARNMNMPESKVRKCFNNRRAKQRASEKKAQISSLSDAKAPLVLPSGEGRKGEESDRLAPGLAASAAEWRGIELEDRGRKRKKGEKPSAVETSGVTDEWAQEGVSSSSGKNEYRPQKPVPEHRWDAGDVQHVSGLMPRVQQMQPVGSWVQSVSQMEPGVQPVTTPVPHVQPMPISVDEMK